MKKNSPTEQNCTACFKYWSCRKPDRKEGRGCYEFVQKGALVEIAEAPKENLKDTKPVRSFLSYDQDAEELSDVEDYSNYFAASSQGLNLPEQDFPQAKNLYEFVFGRKFLNLGATGLYARQFGIGINFFTEYCTNCSDMAYVKKNFEVTDSIDTVLERVVLLEHGTCPRCKATKLELTRDHVLWDNWELAALCGQRSGKSLMAAIFSAYTLHKFLKLPSVAEAFEVAKPTVFLGTFVALDKSQIQDSTWGYLQNLIRDTPWFINYCNMLKDYGRRSGRRLVDIDKVETLEFYHKNLKLNMAAPRPGALRGRTGFLGVIDEIGFLKAKDGEGRVITADEVYASLNNRMGTLVTAFENRRATNLHLPTPIFMNISSPAHARDKICSLVKGIQEQNNDPNDSRTLRRYAVTYPTWDINPMFPRDSSYISSKYKTEPKEAERDFGAKPPLSENSFIEDVNALRENFTTKENLLEIDYTLGEKHTNYSIKILRNDFDRNIPRVLALDLGYSGNSTALSVGYYDDATKMTITEALCEIIPGPGSEINFILLSEKVLKPIIELLNVKIVAADRWQSISMLQELEMKMKVKGVTYSLKYGDFHFYKQALMNRKSTFPVTEDTNLLLSCPPEEYPTAYYNKPVSHFFFQCLTVVDEKEKTVRKGDKTTDDLFRANALMHYILNNLVYRDILTQQQRAIHSGPVVHVQTLSGGGMQGSTHTKFSGTTVVVV